MAEINSKFKDRLFSFIFGREENKHWTLELYNAVNSSSYTDPSAVRITTIQQVLYLGMRNDVSFVISNDMNLYEQQSTYNPNMPIRQMQYCGYLYEKHIKEHKLNKYGATQLSLPVPKLVVFYNGRQEIPDETILELKDSFPEGSSSDIAVRVHMLNINYGRNRELLEACKPLKDYSWFVAEVRKNLERRTGDKSIDVEEAVNQAITNMPEESVIKPFLEAHKAEVTGMMLMEYDEAETMDLFREEGRREGLKEGQEKGIKEGETLLAKLMNILFHLGLVDDAKKAATDQTFRNELYKKYNLI